MRPVRAHRRRCPTFGVATPLGLIRRRQREIIDICICYESISLRLPVSLLHAIKAEANRRDVPYQSLIKTALADRFMPRKAA